MHNNVFTISLLIQSKEFVLRYIYIIWFLHMFYMMALHDTAKTFNNGEFPYLNK